MNIGNYELESPLINGGGLVKTVEDVRLMAQTGVSAVLAGSFTLEPRAGNGPNGETVYYRDPVSNITYNALGMPNMGMEALAPKLNEMIDIAHGHGKPFILNFAPVTDRPIEEIAAAFSILERAGVKLDAFELNASCPNVVVENGERHELLSSHPDILADVLAKINEIAANKVPIQTILTRVAPFSKPEEPDKLVKAIAIWVEGVSAFNTFPGGRPIRPDGTPRLEVAGGFGGQSGGGVTKVAEAHMRWLMRAYSRYDYVSFDIIGSNGVVDGASMKRRLDMGATAVSATTLFWESRSWASAADKILREYADLQAD